ncbi:hypothetical protein ACOZ4L_16005 (plasmid) [Haloplanus ruber]|uniref:DUF7979 domain-containing protein n=1 Tax=Haloplanus ruber TaxID=869892 RepID=A0ABD6D224_9EURY|nr:hypothetical protein [Haloplanus ruber]
MSKRSTILIAIFVIAIVVTSGAYIVSQRLSTENHEAISVEPVNGSNFDGHLISYDNLTAAQQSAFLDALNEDGLVEVDDDVDTSVWIEYDAVRYRGDLFRVYVAVGD